MAIKCYCANEVLQGVIKNIADKALMKFEFPEILWVEYNNDPFNSRQDIAEFNSACLIETNEKQFLIALAKIKDREHVKNIIVAIDFTKEAYRVGVERRLNKLNPKSITEFSNQFIKQIGGDPSEPAIKARLLIEDFDYKKSFVIGVSESGDFIYNRMYKFLKEYGTIPDYNNFAIKSGGYIVDLIDVMSNGIFDNITMLAKPIK